MPPILTALAKSGLQKSLKNFFVSTVEKQLGKTSIFDNAVFKVTHIKANKFNFDIEFPETVKMFEDIIKRGERPKVLTMTKGKNTSLIDGIHKLQAYKNLGIEDIPSVNAKMDL